MVLTTPTMADVKKFLDWAKDQPGIAAAEVDMMTELTYVPQTFKELLDSRRIETARIAR